MYASPLNRFFSLFIYKNLLEYKQVKTKISHRLHTGIPLLSPLSLEEEHPDVNQDSFLVGINDIM